MRKVPVPAVPFHGGRLTAELIDAGVPMRLPPAVRSLGDDVYVSGGTLVVLVDVADDDDAHDALVAETVEAHVRPADPTPKRVLRERILAKIDAGDEELTALVRAAARELYEQDVRIGQAFNGLRQRLIANGQNMTGVPALAGVTWAEFVQKIKDRLAADLAG